MPARENARCVLGCLQRSVINPVVGLVWSLRIPIPPGALLGTIGRSSGLPRRTPVCDGLDSETFWLIALHGGAADCVRTIEVNHGPRQGQRGLADTVPLGRAGTPQDVAGTVAFIASNASKFITGQDILVAGGGGLSA